MLVAQDLHCPALYSTNQASVLPETSRSTQLFQYKTDKPCTPVADKQLFSPILHFHLKQKAVPFSESSDGIASSLSLGSMSMYLDQVLLHFMMLLFH